MKFALIFPGQGSQVTGMGKILYDQFPESKNVIDRANEILGWDLRAKMFTGTDEELRQTLVTQPAIFTVSSAAYEALSKRINLSDGKCAFSAGHSLGEYSALYSSKVFDFQTGLKLVEYRGRFIQECCGKYPGTMAAVLGMDRETLKSLCAECAGEKGVCEMVNFNSPGQIVVAGSKEAIETLAGKISAVPGAKAILLNVSGAFHSALMREAAQKMAETLKGAELKNAAVPVFTNVDASAATQAEDFRRKLAAQVDHPVLWEDSVRKMAESGAEAFIEVGPGKVLCGILRKIDRKMKTLNVEDADSLNKTLKEMENLTNAIKG